MVEPYVSLSSLLLSLRGTEEPRFFHLSTVFFLFAADRSGSEGGGILSLSGTFEVFSPTASPLTTSFKPVSSSRK